MANVKDLSSQEWYHGPITRQNAVTLLYSEGDFIVRDCISNPGDYGMEIFKDFLLSSMAIHVRFKLCNFWKKEKGIGVWLFQNR